MKCKIKRMRTYQENNAFDCLVLHATDFLFNCVVLKYFGISHPNVQSSIVLKQLVWITPGHYCMYGVVSRRNAHPVHSPILSAVFFAALTTL